MDFLRWLFLTPYSEMTLLHGLTILAIVVAGILVIAIFDLVISKKRKSGER